MAHWAPPRGVALSWGKGNKKETGSVGEGANVLRAPDLHGGRHEAVTTLLRQRVLKRTPDTIRKTTSADLRSAPTQQSQILTETW